ncbi:hypothetical protein GLW05_18825 [Pontibacillus yanchengensis]|uniref:Uncharacterized protein n=2 Tax=Pontibacillus yanchengensis TaxID=462910 RepID=A0A6I5A5L2_9BACI|nr:hypothetical protein [Pontibacillus yanchengensis]
MKLNLHYQKLTQDQEEELNSVTTSRNWGSHVPSSLVHSTYKKAFNIEVDIDKPIFITEFKNYQGIWLTSLYEESFKNLQGYKGLFELVKKDYEKLTGNPCIIKCNEYPVRDISDLKIPKISYAIQKKEIKNIEDIKDLYKT